MGLFSVAAVFSNNMVLRCRHRSRVFGTAAAGAVITGILTAPDETEREYQAYADEDGRWELTIGENEPGTGYVLVVSDGQESKRFDNVAFGEVFLAGGQSNMELELRNCAEWKQIQERLCAGTETSHDGEVRFYYTQKRSYFTDEFYENERNSAWQLVGDEWWGAWSAVGYFFAKKLARELKLPIGIIGCNWGGTSACCWMSREKILACDATRIYVDEYDNSPYTKKTEAEQIEDYEAYVKRQGEWDRKSGELYATIPGITWNEVLSKLGPCEYPGPVNCASFLRPAGLYETMLKRVIPYTLSGVIYYQGESDDHRPDAYYSLFKNMIDCWREEFADPKLPFILTQLPMHRYAQDPDYQHWCRIREAQARVAAEDPDSYMAVAIDQGEWNEIHPKSKRRVGERLAMLALSHIYGRMSIEASEAPRFRSFCCKAGRTTVEFDNLSDACAHPLIVMQRLYGAENFFDGASGTKAVDGSYVNGTDTESSVNGFEVAGDDGEFYPARAVIEGRTVVLTCEKVDEVRAVRYLWTNYSDVTLYGMREGMEPLPVAPFRT